MENILSNVKHAGSLPWLKDSLILLVESGSYSYGTNVDTSDKDFKGICVPPLRYHIGLDKFEHIASEGDNNQKNTAEDVDVTIYSLNKFVRLALNGNPNILEMLFVDEESIIYTSSIGRELIKHRYLFLTNKITKSFGGFALSHVQKVKRQTEEDDNHLFNPNAPYDFDRKKVMHAVRVYEMAIEAFESGTMRTRRPNAHTLIDIRKGRFTLTEAIHLLEKLEGDFKNARDGSVLPNKPNVKQINKLLIHLTGEHLDIPTE